MSKKAWTIVSAAAVLCMVGIIAASTLMGACEKMIECTTGNVPMRCHWAYIGTTIIGALGVVTSACALIAKGKESRRLLAVCTLAVAAACAVCLTSVGIGICPSGMQCQETAPVAWGLCVVAAVCAIVQVVKADPEQAELPKMGL